jgi:hypothetical protein
MLLADGESESHSANVDDLRAHYGRCRSFERCGTPYHQHHNEPVDTMLHRLLKRVKRVPCGPKGW